ncbi:SDR family oxidoreductase [Marinovum sp. 2_MG-2023]|uniref:SDR family oxidoreductase n=1 Tax=unclassified Marinovum TaxID=2647166 RepID=UPI0026E3227B|nr:MULTISPECIES: SDR family oxidoreductase [unclassified Marinovum]MDO6731169.1 SDR family oxidoreductase [Marinovum sp. 2_MG-2023]MDO6778666.1 SDR family oxidoreductase [Marinovum sp. 1_MG-2023]
MTQSTAKTCFVTAAGQGIGRAIAIGLRAAGHEVFATDLRADLLADLRSDHGIETAQLDVTDPAAIAALQERLSQTDMLFHCAGFVHSGTVLDLSDADYDFSFDLNVRAAFRMAQAVLPGMVARQSGSLVFIASVASSIKGVPNRAVYGASKAAVLGLSKSIAADFVKQGIRSNCICPGTVETPSLGQRIEDSGPDVQAQRHAFIARQPMGRLGVPEEIAALAVFLADPNADFITGQALAVDGGWTI